MTKLKTPLLSFDAHGTIGNSITIQRRARGRFVREKPIPSQPFTLAQVYHRWLYQDYAFLWHTLSTAEKQQYEADARRRRITGFNLWMSEHLALLPDIAGRWHLDEFSGLTAYDSSKKGNDGVIFGATHVPGYIGNALLFDSLNDELNCGNDSSLNITGEITIEARVKLAHLDIAQYGAIVARFGTVEQSYLLRVMNFTSLHVQADGVAPPFWLVVPNAFTDTDWHYVAARYDGVALKLFMDRVEIGSVVTGGGAMSSTPTQDTQIGRYTTHTFDGIIDDVTIYNRALAPSELLRHAERRYPQS